MGIMGAFLKLPTKKREWRNTTLIVPKKSYD